MVGARMLGRAQKLAYRTAWGALGAFGGSPAIEVHLRRRDEAVKFDPWRPYGSRGKMWAEEYVKTYHGPAAIEPDYGYVVDGRFHLISESLTPDWVDRRRPWMFALPSPAYAFQLRRLDWQKGPDYPHVVSLRHFYDYNYFHFLFDVVGKLQLLDEAGIDATIPLVLGPYAASLPFVQAFLNMGRLTERTWIIQQDAPIMANCITYARTRRSYRDRFNFVVDSLGVPPADPSADARIFLDRGPGASRRITNQEEVRALLDGFGFRTIDTATMAVDEQIATFAQTRYLVAIHGAGMTNMIFRRGAPMRVIELRPQGYFDAGMELICQAFGFDNTVLDCRPNGGNLQNTDITVDLDELSSRVRAMLARG